MLKIGETVFGQDKRGYYYAGSIIEIINIDLVKIKFNNEIYEIHNIKKTIGDEVIDLNAMQSFTDDELIQELRNRGYVLSIH